MILPEHGGESVFQQDYLRGMQYNVYAKALFAPCGVGDNDAELWF